MNAKKTCGNNTWTEKNEWWPLSDGNDDNVSRDAARASRDVVVREVNVDEDLKVKVVVVDVLEAEEDDKVVVKDVSELLNVKDIVNRVYGEG